MTAIAVAAMGVALAAGVRGTWSPCGLSMLSTITPIGEGGRGHRYATTARWYIAGAVLGGLSLGAVSAAAAAGVDRLELSVRTASFVAVVATVVAIASDARVGGFEVPTHRRQVNERWLDEFRPWVYGAGFGLQIGTGLATYITTASNYLVVVLLALTASPPLALAVGAAYGLVRGVAVLLTRNVRSASDLVGVHTAVQRWGAPVLAGVVAMQTAGAALIAFAASGAVAGSALLLAGALMWGSGRARVRPACALDAIRDPRDPRVPIR